MPTLGVGLGLRGEICEQTLAQRKEIDFLEFTPENYRDNIANINWLTNFYQYFPFVSHSVSLSIGSIDPLDRELLKNTRSFIKRFNLKWWSDHLCFTGVDGKTGNDLFPLPWTNETIKHVASKVKQAQDIVELPLILENIPFYTKMPGGDYDEAEFIANILEEADCGMLLDLNNLFVNSINHKFDPYKFLDRLPLERVVQIHLAGPGSFGKRVIDTHGAPVPEPVFQLLDYVLQKNIQAKAIMIERDQFFPKFPEILAELQHVRRIYDKYKNDTDTAAEISAKERHEKQETCTASTENAPPPAMAEMPELDTTMPLPVEQKIQSSSSLSGNAVDPSISFSNLAAYERRWFELWTELIGALPEAVDAKTFAPRFAHEPSATDGFDLKALSIYSWLRDCNRDSLMRRAYPAGFRLLCDDWQKLLNDYFYNFRPSYSDNRKVGDRFPEFMKLHHLQYQNTYPYLFELLEFEHLKQAAGRKHELTDFSGEVYLGSTEQIKSMRPLVNPELTIRSFIYAVHEITAALLEQVQAPAAPLDNPIVYGFLPQSWASKVIRLSSSALKLIDLARPGKRSYSQLIASLMTDEQQQSPETIANYIQMFQTLHQEKVFIGCIPLSSAESTSCWEDYGKAVSAFEPHKTLLLATQKYMEAHPTPGWAVDLGCGSGRDTKHLLRNGWKVLAVDSSAEALSLLRSACDEQAKALLQTEQTAMQDFSFPKADLINAGVSLPFCPPDLFAQLWDKLCRALHPGDRFSGHFFGINDDWAVNKKMTFQSAQQIRELFRNFEFEYYNEMEGQMPIVPSGFRHGHLFEIVARKI